MRSGRDLDRRGTDPLIIQMHGMLSKLIQQMDDHIREDDKAHAKIESMDNRLSPIEEFHGSMKTAGKAVAIAGAPILIGIGATVWAWVRSVVAHTKLTP